MKPILNLIDAHHFYSADAGPGRGRGLFCHIDLQPGDAWWQWTLDDPRYIARVIPWAEYLTLPESERRKVETLCYFDADAQSLVICAEPFCRVNHATLTANSKSDDDGYSVVTRPITAGTEITIPYDYEAVISIVWKFPSFRQMMTAEQLADTAFLFQRVTDVPLAMQFFNQFD
ncbi:hypothetical protein BH11PLA2_BH11PLA2_49630 [soil metagenome]